MITASVTLNLDFTVTVRVWIMMDMNNDQFIMWHVMELISQLNS